jgi:phosphatidylethanolamine-binding protein (PEBP) family uncharacterized protein
VLLQDADAPGGTFVHWTLYGLAPRRAGALTARGEQGFNGFGRLGWGAPCPPQGATPHHYVFTLYALPRPSSLRAGAPASSVRAALAAPLARGRLVGTYSR